MEECSGLRIVSELLIQIRTKARFRRASDN